MAKKKIKPTPAGILFLSAIAVLVIALITVAIVLISNCNKSGSRNKPTVSPTATIEATEEPSIEPTTAVVTPDPALNPIDPNTTTDPNATTDPDATTDPGNSGDPVINTPPSQATANPSATALDYYTEPTSTMKKNAKDGYVSGDKVNMRKGPGTKYDKVKSDIAKNTKLTLYVEQDGWWFVKCDSKYGYIKNDYVKTGSAPSGATGEVSGTVNASTIALRKDASNSSQCIKEYTKGEAVTIYYKSSDGKWYYVKVKSDGKKGWMYADYVKASGKVGTKS